MAQQLETRPASYSASAAFIDGETHAIPSASRGKRLSPALDPIARMRLAATAKWMLVTGILLLIVGIPFLFPRAPLPTDEKVTAAQEAVNRADATFQSAKKAAGGGKGRAVNYDALDALEQSKKDLAAKQRTLAAARKSFDTQKKASDRGNLAAVIASAMLAATFATGLPRLVLPGVFGRWHEAVEAMRDWLVVGLVTGGLYLLTLAVFKLITPPAGNRVLGNLIELTDAGTGTFDPIWLEYRLPIILLCALVGLFIARQIALRAEGIIADNALKALFEVVLQAGLIGILIRPLERGLHNAGLAGPALGNVVLGVALLFIAGALGVIVWAGEADQHVTALHRRGKPVMTGVDAGDQPVPMTLSVIGGRESGKTVLMAAAYYEWLTSPFGHLRIKPAPSPTDFRAVTSGGGGGTNLDQVADELYVSNQFPVGTVSTQNLPFDIAHGKEPVCRFSMLDFPGGAIVGSAADQRIVEEFWERLENSDALLIIADMSYVRRGKKDPGFTQVFGAYIEAMRRLSDRNGRRRVIPIALVLTKCDEYFDPNLGGLNFDAIRKGMEEFGYNGLESAWRQMCKEEGQKVIEFEIFTTSAITYSEPQVDENGEYDFSRPFRIIPPPPAITPNGCAAPILWLTAKVMRWNVTAFRDLSSFLLGSSPRQRRRIESIIEMERVAEEKKAARVNTVIR